MTLQLRTQDIFLDLKNKINKSNIKKLYLLIIFLRMKKRIIINQ